MEVPAALLARLVLSAQRALRDQTPETLLAYSCTIDMMRKVILLKAHFCPMPSRDDVDAIQIAETEIYVDFEPEFQAETEFELVMEGIRPVLLPGATVYRRDEPAAP